MLRKRQFDLGKSRQRKKNRSLQDIAPFGWVLIVFFVMALIALGEKGYQKAIDLSYPLQYTEYVEQWANEYEVDPLLVYSFIRTESGFDKKAQSNVDARGLMQITSDTFDWIKSKIAPDSDLVFDNLYDPAVNIQFGTYYLSRCLARYQNDIETAAAAYHSGWGTVDDLLVQEIYSSDGMILNEFPYTQMKNYVSKIAACYEKYNELYGSEKVV